MKNALLLLLLFVVAFGMTVVLMRWRPTSERGDALDVAAESAAARAVAERIAAASGDADVSEITVRESELRALVLDALVASSVGSRLLEVARGLEVRLDDGDLRVEILLSTAEIGESLTGEAIDSLLGLVRLVAGQDLRLGVRGRPAVQAGELGFDPEGLEILIGPLSLDADDLEDQVGIDSAEIADGLSLAIGDRRLRGVRQADGALVLSLEPAA
jgi:hypothetical protein